MADLKLEEQMLVSAYQDFELTVGKIEEKLKDRDSVYLKFNDIQLLNDIYEQAKLHIECFISHEKLLMDDQKRLITKNELLINEYREITERINKRNPKANPSLVKAAKKEKLFLESEILKYQGKIKELNKQEKKCSKSFDKSCSLAREKDSEISRLSESLKKLHSFISQKGSDNSLVACINQLSPSKGSIGNSN